MLTIRNSQKELFDNHAMRHFEERTLVRLRKYFPKHCAAVNDDEAVLRRIIRAGHSKAKQYDLTFESGAVLVTDLMFLFGSGFDTDPQYPWAAQWLTCQRPTEQHIKIEAIYLDAVDCAKGIYGPDNAYFKKTLQTILRRRSEESPFVPPERMPAFLRQTLQGLSPEKCRYIGDKALQNLITHVLAAAGRQGITSTGGTVAYGVAMFVLGYRFETDLLFPWAGKIFRKNSVSGEGKIAAFQQAANQFLEKWWAGAA
ncbi:MAG: hypothetical protein V2B19_00545 [Pseudomonadota bacterium]